MLDGCVLAMDDNEKTNVFAILGFIFSFLFSFAGLVLSILGFEKSKKCNNGKVLSIAGIIISTLFIISSLVFLFYNFNYNNNDDDIIGNEEENLKYGSDYNKNEIDEILGEYEFYEYSEPYQNMIYTLNVYKENDLYYADLNIDGFQTMYRMKLFIKYINNNYIFELYENYDSNYNGIYSIGDNMFELYEKEGNYYTKWDNMKPMLSSNEVDGIYFKKLMN